MGEHLKIVIFKITVSVKVREVYVKAYVKGIDKGVKNTVPVKVREVYVKVSVKFV